jgi:hypothetical protein
MEINEKAFEAAARIMADNGRVARAISNMTVAATIAIGLAMGNERRARSIVNVAMAGVVVIGITSAAALIMAAGAATNRKKSDVFDAEAVETE